MKRPNGLIYLTLLASASISLAHAASASDPCAGSSGLLGLLDRPTVGDASCIVPQGKTVAEAGFSLGRIYGGSGAIDTAPNLELRWGLPGNSEFVWLPPNLQYERYDARGGTPALTQRGFGPTTLGIKQQVALSAHWQWSAEALATLPSGDGRFGSHGIGGAVNGIVSYSSGGPLGVSLMVGITSQTEPTMAGGNRYQSFNPDLVVTWEPTPKLQFYLEAYGQSHSGYRQGWGSDADGGVQYLLAPNVEVDLEGGVRIQGNLGGFTHYVGAGLGVMF